MKNSKVLEMINNGQIEELKNMLRDEIYTEVLNTNPSAKKRYAAMKRYFKYQKAPREILEKPCLVEYQDESYVSFCNSHSLVLTKEPCGVMEMCDDPERYPDVVKLINYDGSVRRVDFGRIIAEAKSLGYGLKKSELDTQKYQYLMHYDNAYFKLGLLDITYGVIDNGEESNVYHAHSDGRTPIVIENKVGVCIVMPVNFEDGEPDENKIVIDVD